MKKTILVLSIIVLTSAFAQVSNVSPGDEITSATMNQIIDQSNLNKLQNVNTVSNESSSFTASYGGFHQITTTSGPVSATLPTAANKMGQKILLKHKAGSNQVQITSSGGNIDGSSSLTLYVPGDQVLLISDDTNWVVLEKKDAPITFFAQKAAVASGLNTSAADIKLGDVHYDTVGGYSSTLTTSIYTVKAPGRYEFSGNLLLENVEGSHNPWACVTINGSCLSQTYCTSLPASSGSKTCPIPSMTIDLLVGYEIGLYVSGGGPSFSINGGNNRTFMYMRRK